MAYTTIDKPTDYFNTKIYAPDGSSSFAVTGVGFQPDWIWLKSRIYAEDHQLNDSVRGATKGLQSNLTNAETTQSNGLTSFDSDGFTVGNLSDYNYNGDSIVSWNWKAGTSFTNDASATGIGTIDSTGSVNETAGISIISFTGTGANGTIKHGLSTAPRAMIFKNRDQGAEGWFVYHESVGNTKRAGLLNETSAPSTSSTFFQDTSPTSSIITLGSNHGVNGSDAMICYAFSERQGFSKFGQYTGNGNANGTFVYLGFKPAWLMIKPLATASWRIWDNKREDYNGNVNQTTFNANENGAEYDDSSVAIDFLSNGFKGRSSNSDISGSGTSYIYLAFAEEPFVSSGGIPCTAR